jgi:hypothetical protein
MSRITKWTAPLLFVLSLFTAVRPLQAQANAELSQIQRVYIMPMNNAFDQYLANRLRNIQQIRVVTDPTRADAYFTDRLGVSFENKLDEIEIKTKELAAQEQPAAETDAEKEKQQGFRLAPPLTSSIGRAKGTLFLVDRRSRNVVWSIYERPKDTQPRTLDKVADKVAEELAKEYGEKKK